MYYIFLQDLRNFDILWKGGVWVSKGKLLICSLACVCVLGISCIGSYSYFTDSSKTVNGFTTADLSIDLQENSHDALSDSNSNGVKDTATNLVQGKVIETDPKIVNNSTIGVYAIMVVDIPTRSVMTVESAPNKVSTELFSYSINSDWKLMSTKSIDGYTRRVYAYTKATSVGGQTSTLFDSVVYADVVEGQITDKLTIPITGYAIQQNGFSSYTDAYNSFDWNQ